MRSQILVELQESMGSDLSVANAAWTSTYDKNRREHKYEDTEKVELLVRDLILQGHGTPVESVVFRFWIKMPIFCDRQHLTHRIASHNGLSARYRTMPEEWFGVPEDVKYIFDKCNGNGYSEVKHYDLICNQSFSNYKRQLNLLKTSEQQGSITNAEFKRAREIIRGQLPTSGMVERTTIMNLRSFANYQKQRNSIHAQPEIKKVAELMLQEVKNANIAPIAIKTLEEKGWDI